jgi:hypothetical protein
LIRQKFRPDDFVPPKERVDAIKSMQGFTVGELLRMRDGPFAEGYFIDQVQRDGKSWWRLCSVLEEWCLLLEDVDDYVAYAQVTALPPDEARDVSKTYDARRPGRVVDAP